MDSDVSNEVGLGLSDVDVESTVKFGPADLGNTTWATSLFSLTKIQISQADCQRTGSCKFKRALSRLS